MKNHLSIIKKIKEKSFNYFLKRGKLYLKEIASRNRNRAFYYENINKSDLQWVKELGYKSIKDGLKGMSEKFYDDELSVFPTPLCVKEGFNDVSIKTAVEFFKKHEFDLLGSGWKSPKIIEKESIIRKKSLGERIRSLSEVESTLVSSLDTYSPIDWHLDIKSGFRWTEDVWYTDIVPGIPAGVEIKMPWELSRFYHAGLLGYYVHANGDSNMANELQLQICDWVNANPVYKGPNWRVAMESGLRATNWLLGISYLKEINLVSPDFILIMGRSLYEHGKFIENNLEKTPFGANNHYLGNLVGLISIGAAMPWLPRSDEWLLFGIKEIVSEMKRQVYEEGTHFECSTSYHRLATEIFTCSYNIVQMLPEKRRKRFAKYKELNDKCRMKGIDFDSSEVFPKWFIKRIVSMGDFLKKISKESGEIPQIGDNDSGRLFWLPLPVNKVASDGIEWNTNEHESLCEFINKEIPNGNFQVKKKENSFEYYKEFGIAIYRCECFYFVVSFGGNGPKYITGHSHNDQLSYELMVNGSNFVVDPGTYVYTSEPDMRNYFRSRRAHSAIIFDGTEQNDYEGESLFSLPNVPRPELLVSESQRLVIRDIVHNKYLIREFIINKDALLIKDSSEIAGGFVTVNLYPGVNWVEGLLFNDKVGLSLDSEGIERSYTEPSFYSPRYGVKKESKRLIMKRSAKESSYQLKLV